MLGFKIVGIYFLSTVMIRKPGAEERVNQFVVDFSTLLSEIMNGWREIQNFNYPYPTTHIWKKNLPKWEPLRLTV